MFADKGFWDFAAEQSSSVVVTGIFVYAGFRFLQWAVTRYVGPISDQLRENGGTLVTIAKANDEIVKSNQKIQEILEEHPSDLVGKLAAAKCPLTRDEVAAIVDFARRQREGAV